MTKNLKTTRTCYKMFDKCLVCAPHCLSIKSLKSVFTQKASFMEILNYFCQGPKRVSESLDMSQRGPLVCISTRKKKEERDGGAELSGWMTEEKEEMLNSLGEILLT